MQTIKPLTKNELKKRLANQYEIRLSVSQSMTIAQLKALFDSLEKESPLSQAIQIIINERNAKAKKNSNLGLNNYHLKSKLEATRETLSYVERQLEAYKDQFKELLEDLLTLEKSEILQGIKSILARLQ